MVWIWNRICLGQNSTIIFAGLRCEFIICKWQSGSVPVASPHDTHATQCSKQKGSVSGETGVPFPFC